MPLSGNDAGRARAGPAAADRPRTTARSSEEVCWVAEMLGMRLASLWYRRIQVDERRHKRERSWLFGIINAVTDPILLTDAGGPHPGRQRRAPRCCSPPTRRRARGGAAPSPSTTCSSRPRSSPSRRGAVPPAASCCWSIPSEGQDLLFEVLLDAGHDPPRRDRASSRCCATSPTCAGPARRSRRTTAGCAIAEAATRAERDRLDLILNSVLDPILVTDPGGNIVRMNPPAERMFTVAPAPAYRGSGAPGARQRRGVHLLRLEPLRRAVAALARRAQPARSRDRRRRCRSRRSPARWSPSTARRRRSSPSSTT